MSIIEQAAKRLDELKRAGMSVPGDYGQAGADDAAGGDSHAVPDSPELEAPVAHEVGQTVKAVASLASSWSAPNEESTHRVNIDLAALAAKNFVTPESSRSQLADELRVIKRPLLVNARGNGGAPLKNGNLVMVTSSLPGEGKSFTAINLAMSIAMEMDLRVLLVDADVAHSSVLDYLGLPSAKGLLDVLLNEEVDLGDVLLRTNVEKLSILPGGRRYKHATELLASESMRRLIDEIASRYSDRIIIFDSPPLLVTTESRVLATHVGQIVMVVEAGKTPRAAVAQALKTIESCPVVLMMLNKSAASNSGGYGYAGYGYGTY